MGDEAKHYRALATGARNLASMASTEGEKQALAEIAQNYEQLADEADQENRRRA